MRRRFKIRPTGASAWGVGFQWERRETDAEIARRVISLLEDRRMLWVDMSYEYPDHCLASAKQTRDALTDQINSPAISDDLASMLKQIRKLFADFMTTAPRAAAHGQMFGPLSAEPFSVALGSLRAAVGDRLATLVAAYGLDVDEDLATIIPDDGSWFFERFSGEDVEHPAG